MDTLLEVIRFLVAIAALIAWGAVSAVQLVLRRAGRANERLARFLSSTKEEYSDYWMALAGVVVIILAAIAIKTAFDRSAWAGWFTIDLLIASGLVLLRLRTRERFARVLIVIVGFVAALADFIFIVVMWAAHGGLIGAGLLVIQVGLILGVVFLAARSWFMPLLMVICYLLALAAPIGLGVGVIALDEYVGRPAALSLLALSLVATGVAGPYIWWRDRDPESLGLILGYLSVWAIFLCSAAFAMSSAIGWQAIAVLAISTSLAVVIALRSRPRLGSNRGPVTQSGADGQALGADPTLSDHGT